MQLPRLPRLGAYLLAALGSLTLFAAVHADDKDKSAAPPKGAIVLFDGKNLDGWASRKGGGPTKWLVKEDFMECLPGSGDILTKNKFTDYQLHVEFWVPLMPDAKGQGRGNSGVYQQGRYEVQVLDSYNNETYPDGACAALYKILTPSKNASKPPETWQTYDITFKAPRVDADGKVAEKGEITVVHNGEKVIDKGRFDKPTGGELDRKLGEPGPILLQDHGNKVRFRNIWIIPTEAK